MGDFDAFARSISEKAAQEARASVKNILDFSSTSASPQRQIPIQPLHGTPSDIVKSRMASFQTTPSRPLPQSAPPVVFQPNSPEQAKDFVRQKMASFANPGSLYGDVSSEEAARRMVRAKFEKMASSHSASPLVSPRNTSRGSHSSSITLSPEEVGLFHLPIFFLISLSVQIQFAKQQAIAKVRQECNELQQKMASGVFDAGGIGAGTPFFSADMPRQSGNFVSFVEPQPLYYHPNPQPQSSRGPESAHGARDVVRALRAMNESTGWRP